MAELTLAELAAAANGMGFPAEVTNTGGGVMALTLAVHGHHALIALDYGHTSGSTWAVSLDGETREKYGEAEADDLPVTSDAEQTIRDAREWVLAHAVVVDRMTEPDSFPVAGPPHINTPLVCPGCGQHITVVLEDSSGGPLYTECGGEGNGGCDVWIDGDPACEAQHRAAIQGAW